MPYRILYTESYSRRVARFLSKHPAIVPTYRKVLQLLELDPFHPSLRLHRLHGRLKDLHSVSINLTYRVTIVFMIKEGTIIPVSIGSHDDVY